jgi:hypothetical protein
VTLRELGRLTTRWLDFHDHVWSKVKAADWKGLVRTWPAGDRDKLRELVEDTEGALRSLAAACKESRGTLAELKQGL